MKAYLYSCGTAPDSRSTSLARRLMNGSPASSWDPISR